MFWTNYGGNKKVQMQKSVDYVLGNIVLHRHYITHSSFFWQQQLVFPRYLSRPRDSKAENYFCACLSSAHVCLSMQDMYKICHVLFPSNELSPSVQQSADAVVGKCKE